jgi:hypothetical protein
MQQDINPEYRKLLRNSGKHLDILRPKAKKENLENKIQYIQKWG